MIFEDTSLKKYIKTLIPLGDGDTLASIDFDDADAFRDGLEKMGFNAEKRFTLDKTDGVFYSRCDGETVYLYKNPGVPFVSAVHGARLPEGDSTVGEALYRDTVFYQARNIPNPLKGAMTYFIRLRDGRFIVVDGGGEISPEGFIAAMTELHPLICENEPFTVAAWFITHPHDDHIDVLKKLVCNSDFASRVKIDAMYANLPDEAYLRGVDNGVIPDNNFVRGTCFEYVRSHGGAVSKPFAGMSFSVGEIRIDVMYTAADWGLVERKTVNDASMVFTLSRDNGKKVLILGDIMNRVTVPLLSMYSPEALHADAVQISHHAHVGPDFGFYGIINPKIFFWPISIDCYFLPEDNSITVRNNKLREVDAVHMMAYLGASQVIL